MHSFLLHTCPFVSVSQLLSQPYIVVVLALPITMKAPIHRKSVTYNQARPMLLCVGWRCLYTCCSLALVLGRFPNYRRRPPQTSQHRLRLHTMKLNWKKIWKPVLRPKHKNGFMYINLKIIYFTRYRTTLIISIRSEYWVWWGGGVVVSSSRTERSFCL